MSPIPHPAPDAAAPRRVGILGGMGPAATLDLMAKVLAETPARRDAEHVPLIVWNVPQVPDRPAALRGHGPSPLPAMAEGARFLEQSGASAVAIACNTAHHWAEELQRGLSIPLLHIADAALEAIGEPGTKVVGMLGTGATLESGFYARRLQQRGVRWLGPTAGEQAAVDAAIAKVKSGDIAAARTDFERAGGAMLARGAHVLLLACTELPIAAAGSTLEDRVVDPTLALARAIVRHAFAPCGTRGAQVS